MLTGVAGADPAGGSAPNPVPGLTQVPYSDPWRSEDAPAAPLPVITPTPSNWEPQFPLPYDQMRDEVTPADITAMGEMCQWYNAQYDELNGQIDRINVNLIKANGNYATPGIAAQADAVAANLDRSLDFLTPRANALTISRNYVGDLYFPVYQGESFYRLWEQLTNVRDGIKGRQPAWFTGPSFQHAMRFGSKIDRSHICDQGNGP
ncbi:hypothetical protein [Mycolicibacterium sp. XJ879]